jgi:hypothetical protein
VSSARSPGRSLLRLVLSSTCMWLSRTRLTARMGPRDRSLLRYPGTQRDITGTSSNLDVWVDIKRLLCLDCAGPFARRTPGGDHHIVSFKQGLVDKAAIESSINMHNVSSADNARCFLPARRFLRQERTRLRLRALPVTEVASVGDAVGLLSEALASIAPGPFGPLVATLGSDVADVANFQPSGLGLARLSVRSTIPAMGLRSDNVHQMIKKSVDTIHPIRVVMANWCPMPAQPAKCGL